MIGNGVNEWYGSKNMACKNPNCKNKDYCNCKSCNEKSNRKTASGIVQSVKNACCNCDCCLPVTPHNASSK